MYTYMYMYTCIEGQLVLVHSGSGGTGGRAEHRHQYFVQCFLLI